MKEKLFLIGVIILFIVSTSNTVAKKIVDDDCLCQDIIIRYSSDSEPDQKFYFGLLERDNLPYPIDLPGDPPSA